MPLTASGPLALGRQVPHLFVADLRGRCRDLFEATPYELVRADPDQHCYDISPDGRFVAFGFDPAEEKKLDDEFDIVELDLKSRRFRNLTPGAPHRDYHHLAMRRTARASRAVEQYAGEPVAPNEITLIDRRKGAIAVVSKRWDRSIEARYAGPRTAPPSCVPYRTARANTCSASIWHRDRPLHWCTRHGDRIRHCRGQHCVHP